MANTAKLWFANEENTTRILDTHVLYSLHPMVAGKALRFACRYVPISRPIIVPLVLVMNDDWVPRLVIYDRGERLARNAAREAHRHDNDWNAHEPSSPLPVISAMGRKPTRAITPRKHGTPPSSSGTPA